MRSSYCPIGSEELDTQTRELGRVAGAVEEIEAHHVARRYLTFDDTFIEGGAQLAAYGTGPHRAIHICQSHARLASEVAEINEVRGLAVARDL